MKLEFYIKHYGKSFYWAGKFLKKDIFVDCSILYAFCRIADDLVDNNKNSKSKIDKFIKEYSNIKEMINTAASKQNELLSVINNLFIFICNNLRKFKTKKPVTFLLLVLILIS